MLVIAANGLVFDTLSWGSAGPVVLCLHGFPQRSTSWSAVAERLSGMRVVAPDQRGYSPGARPTDVADYALPHLVADVVAMIESLGAPVHLVGHDWGGVVGWQVAARHPELLASWTAASTPHPLALRDVLAGDESQRERFSYMRLFRQTGKAEEVLLADGGARLAAIYEGSVDRVADEVAFFSRPGVLTAALNWYRAMAPTDADGIGAVEVPTTYVWGAGDLAFGRAAAERTADYVTGPYRFVPIEGASHWLPDERPDVIADVIAEQVRGG